jgi:disulfide oxidoreductase YuzD
MRIIKDTTYTTRQIEKVICDSCNQEIKNKDTYEDNEVKIYAKIGENYPEGDFRKIYITDICKDCFMVIKKILEEKYFIKFRELNSDDFNEKECEY